MSIISSFLKEMEKESITTRKMLSIVPEDKFDWQPHPKSMTVRQLTTHIAEMPTFATLAVTTDELDFNTQPYQPVQINNKEELLQYFETTLADSKAHLAAANENILPETWTMRAGDAIYAQLSKEEAVRMSFSQIVHHRAQLGVFLRLLDVPIPGSYGPSADGM
ncbi:DinB family protein [Chitinophaga niabensis]|uniref:DinB family protein n=1 Tax=Chitinophaga niabensis TaxID=536979 RepID=UPI0031BB55B0